MYYKEKNNTLKRYKEGFFIQNIEQIYRAGFFSKQYRPTVIL